MELVTATTEDQVILPGVMRRSVVELVEERLGGGDGEEGVEVVVRKFTIGEVEEAWREGRLLEAFVSGTAVSFISLLLLLLFLPLPPLSNIKSLKFSITTTTLAPKFDNSLVHTYIHTYLTQLTQATPYQQFFITPVTNIQTNTTNIILPTPPTGTTSYTSLISNWLAGIMYGPEEHPWGVIIDEN